MSRGTVLLIAGSRSWALSRAEIDAALDQTGLESVDIGEVVSGCARGPDRAGEEWAQWHTIPVTFFPADWAKYGKRAGLVRNTEMAKYLANHKKAPEALLFWDGKSRGTNHMIAELEQMIGPGHFRVFYPGELDRHIAGAC